VTRTAWPAIISRAAQIARSYDTLVTLRQLFYRLVAVQAIPNTQVAYKRLSELTAQARRDSAFPALIDRGREIYREACWEGPEEAMAALIEEYRLDRTAGQDMSLYLAVEKAGMVAQLQSWFGGLGVPVLALGGYASQSYVDQVAADVECQGRDAVLLYAGDFDPSGEDIDRDFTERTGCWEKVIRVALSVEQIHQYSLPPSPGKITDSRAGGFIARHGELVQVELDALDPDVLRGLFASAISGYWDTSLFEVVLADEEAGRNRLSAARESMPDG
jgi:hypothetical protein